MARQGADYEFLEKLAAAGGGTFHQATDLPLFLKQLAEQAAPNIGAKVHLWPDWRRTPQSRSVGSQLAALTGSGILLALIIFVGCLCTEWLLRRLWGLV